MPNRFGPGDKQPQRPMVPEGMRVVWTPKNKPSTDQPPQPGSYKADDPKTIDPVTQAQLLVQRHRLEQGRGPAERGSGLVPTAENSHDAETAAYLEEQRSRFRGDGND